MRVVKSYVYRVQSAGKGMLDWAGCTICLSEAIKCLDSLRFYLEWTEIYEYLKNYSMQAFEISKYSGKSWDWDVKRVLSEWPMGILKLFFIQNIETYQLLTFK